MPKEYTQATLAGELGYTGTPDTPDMHMYIIDNIHAQNMKLESNRLIETGMEPEKARKMSRKMADKDRAGAISYQKKLGNIK